MPFHKMILIIKYQYPKWGRRYKKLNKDELKYITELLNKSHQYYYEKAIVSSTFQKEKGLCQGILQKFMGISLSNQ